jgi:hypothetical protein
LRIAAQDDSHIGIAVRTVRLPRPATEQDCLRAIKLPREAAQKQLGSALGFWIYRRVYRHKGWRVVISG